jgi:hypothetical protein
MRASRRKNESTPWIRTIRATPSVITDVFAPLIETMASAIVEAADPELICEASRHCAEAMRLERPGISDRAVLVATFNLQARLASAAASILKERTNGHHT